MPQGRIRGTPGAGNALDVLFLGEIVGQLGAFAGIVVVILVVVDSPVVMEAGVDDHPVVFPNLQAVLLAGRLKLVGHDNMPDVAHLRRIALSGLPLLLELVLEIAHIHNNAGADAAGQRNLRQGVAVLLPVYLLLMEHMVGSIHMGAGMEGAGVGHGSLVEPAQILATGELKILPCAGEGPQGGVCAPGLGQIVNLDHLGIIQILMTLVFGHISHDILLLKNICRCADCRADRKNQGFFPLYFTPWNCSKVNSPLQISYFFAIIPIGRRSQVSRFPGKPEA